MQRLFEVIVPRAVEHELRQRDPLYPQRLYPDAALFEEFRQLMADPPSGEPSPLGRFGRGEAAAIPLAKQMDAYLLINDRRPAAFAESLGVKVLTVPDMIVSLRLRELIPAHMARALLVMSEQHGTSPELVKVAGRLLGSA